jgi:CDP-diacylglycerol--glycerol-3-phosphate 3-phosphatidyltransferase/cardiolipin synthase
MLYKSHLPSALTFLRIIAAPLFFYVFIDGQLILSLLILVFAGFTDILDGYVARKLNLSSVLGAYLDVTADFLLIFSCFLSFIIVGWYDYWVLLLICFLFSLFIVTSSLKKPIYDPIGKYLGSFLIIMAILSILNQETLLKQILLILLILMTIISIISRVLFLSRRIK